MRTWIPKQDCVHTAHPKGLVVVLGVFMLLWAGCATTPSAISKFPYETISMNNAHYFVLMDMCVREGIKWDYDPLSKVVVLKTKDKDIKLLIGSRMIMMGETFQRLSAPVEIRDSIIYAPQDLRTYVTAPLCEGVEQRSIFLPVHLRPITSILLDAGHGGRDPGAVGKYGLKEKEVVLDVVHRIKEELSRCGLKVYLSRSRDEFLPLMQRAEIANEKKVDLFISIHANANRSRWIDGFEVYYLTEIVDDDTRALAAAENAPSEIDSQDFFKQPLPLRATLWDMIYTENRKESIELAQSICSAVSKKLNLKMLGVKGAPFAVLKDAQMSAVLIEVGYISNGYGEKKLRDPQYRQKMAEAIALGIINFKKYCEGKL